MVCVCRKVSWSDIQDLVDSGCDDWYEAAVASGATRYCGSCYKQFRGLFELALRQRRLKTAA